MNIRHGHVSVAMAVYNGGRFLTEQLKSLAGQERLPDELIVSDDASTDSTVQIVREFVRYAPFPVQLLLNDENVGCTKNFERAISACSGEIIFLCDCDDVWYPNKVAVTMETLASHSLAGVATCDADLIDERSEPIGQRLWQRHRFALGRNMRGLSEGMRYSRAIPCYGPGIAFRAALKRLILPLPSQPSFRFGGQDYFIMWGVVAAGAGGIALIDRPLMGYRQHPDQITARLKSRSLPRWRARTQRPLTVLNPLIERLDSPVATELCVNEKMRASALQHWRARCFLPDSKTRRLSIVFREYFSGRYDEFSGGLTTAMKDLFFVC